MSLAGEETEPYTPEYAATRLKVEVEWLKKQAAKGAVPSIKLGRRRMFMESDIQQILTNAACARRTGLSVGSLRAKRRAS